MADAFAAALPSAGLGGDGGVVTDGRSIVMYSNDVNIGSNQYFSCSGPPGAERDQSKQNWAAATPYYTLPNSIVLKAGAALVRRSAHSLFTSCIVRPTWYNYSLFFNVDGTRKLLTVRDVIDHIEHAFTGTATMCGTAANGSNQAGDACNMQDVLILGFDVCDDTRASPRAVISNVKYECNVGEFIHNNGGGMRLETATVENFIETALVNLNGEDVSRFEPAITGIAQDSSNGEVQITVDTMVSGHNEIADGDTVLISGIQNQDGPVGQNARWIVDCGGVSPCASGTFDLKGSSWAGPSYANSFWKAASNVIKTSDTTNIAGGQYVCASGTAPFCQPPNGFGPAAGTIFTLTAGIPSSGVPSSPTGVSSTAKWPQSGLVKVTTAGAAEYLGYTVVTATSIQITARGVDGTTPQLHNSTDPVVPAAPQVIAPVPSFNAVTVNYTATLGNSGSSGDTVAFLNDTYVNCATPGNCGYAILNANYHTWTGAWRDWIAPSTALLLGYSPAGATPDGIPPRPQ